MSTTTTPAAVTEANPASHEGGLTRRDYISTYFRSSFMLGSFNFERFQAIGVAVSLMPTIKRFYHTKHDQAEALKRHLEFFNTTPWIASPIYGVVAAMEEERSKGGEIEDSDITNVKIGLMGPLAGVGDPVFWGTVRPVLAALGASLALAHSILGPLLFFFGINIIRIATRWYGFKFGYQRGTSIVSNLGGGQLKRLTAIASVLGLFVMGSLVSKWTTIKFPLVIASYHAAGGKLVTTTLQSVLDQLLPGMAALLLTFLCMWLLKKKINAIWIIFGMFVIGILGYWSGFLGL